MRARRRPPTPTPHTHTLSQACTHIPSHPPTTIPAPAPGSLSARGLPLLRRIQGTGGRRLCVRVVWKVSALLEGLCDFACACRRGPTPPLGGGLAFQQATTEPPPPPPVPQVARAQPLHARDPVPRHSVSCEGWWWWDGAAASACVPGVGGSVDGCGRVQGLHARAVAAQRPPPPPPPAPLSSTFRNKAAIQMRARFSRAAPPPTQDPPSVPYLPPAAAPLLPPSCPLHPPLILRASRRATASLPHSCPPHLICAPHLHPSLARPRTPPPSPPLTHPATHHPPTSHPLSIERPCAASRLLAPALPISFSQTFLSRDHQAVVHRLPPPHCCPSAPHGAMCKPQNMTCLPLGHSLCAVVVTGRVQGACVTLAASPPRIPPPPPLCVCGWPPPSPPLDG